jgi:hypothetical protein
MTAKRPRRVQDPSITAVWTVAIFGCVVPAFCHGPAKLLAANRLHALTEEFALEQFHLNLRFTLARANVSVASDTVTVLSLSRSVTCRRPSAGSSPS